ncbi:MAG: 6-bladed beta-propeller, partial [Methanomicrobiales archaeon]|nr:6-bladed beta-propeller [Methanomicrobiales archaeon]
MRRIVFLAVIVLAAMVPAALASDECMAERVDLPPDAPPALTARQDSEGLEYAFVMTWGTKTYAEDGDFDIPKSVTVDTDGNVYVADRGNRRIQKFDGDGNLLTKWGSHGEGDGEFRQPSCIAVDAADNIYVTDVENNCIQKFDSDGNFLAKWELHSIGNKEAWSVDSIAVDTPGNIYVY